MASLRRTLARSFTGLWRDPEFMKLWSSMTITAFGAQITNLALPLTAAVMLSATPMQMGILVALETLPFALVSLHAGVLIDRVRKLPIVIAANWGRGLALLAIPAAAYAGALTIEILFVVGFICGIQNVVGGAAYQVLLAQMAGRERLVEANAKLYARRNVVGADRPRSRRRADPAPDRAVRDRARCLHVLRLGADAAPDPPAARRRAPRAEGFRDGGDPGGPEARVEQPHAPGARVAGGTVADPAPHADGRADPVRDPRSRVVGRCDRTDTRSAASGACSPPRWQNGSPRGWALSP